MVKRGRRFVAVISGAGSHPRNQFLSLAVISGEIFYHRLHSIRRERSTIFFPHFLDCGSPGGPIHGRLGGDIIGRMANLAIGGNKFGAGR